MKNNFLPFIQLFLINCFVLPVTISAYSQVEKVKIATGTGKYQCIPCGNDCDNISCDKPGKCLHCQMQLIKKSTIVFKEISPAAICEYIRKYPNTILLDVRTKEEFEGKADPDFGTLKNSMNIPVQELEKRLPEIGNLKKKEIIVYCSHSHRSPQASYLLTQHGFHKIINMTGGMSVMADKACVK